MDAALFQQLNRIYAPLRGRAVRLTRLLAEFQLSREAALAFDWGQLPQDAEVYGVEQYPMDFYTAGMDRAGIAGRIAESTEQAVNAALSFPPDAPDDTLLVAAENCRRWKSGDKP